MIELLGFEIPRPITVIIGCGLFPVALWLVLLRDWLKERRDLREARKFAAILMKRRGG